MFDIPILRPLAAVLTLGLVALGASSAFSADQFRYVGFTDDVFDGAQGYFAPHRECADNYGDDAVWCTTQMAIEGGPAAGVLDPPFTVEIPGVWINPTPTGGFLSTGPFNEKLMDFSGRAITPLNSNCNFWTSSTTAFTGMTVRGQSGAVDFVNAPCGTDRPAACCALEGGGPPDRE